MQFMAKRGKKLERLVAWIETALAETAEVVPNAKLRDKDTGKLRQVDVAVFLKDSHHHLLVMVEVRDRARPIGSPYIEETYGKAMSIGAANVVIVSSSGFYRPARQKANARGIRLLTYQEAVSGDWARWLSARRMGLIELGFLVKKATVFVDPQDAKAHPTREVLRLLKEKPIPLDTASIERRSDFRKFSIVEVVHSAIKNRPDIWKEVVQSALSTPKTFTIKFEGDSPMLVINKSRIPIWQLKVSLEFQTRTSETPLKFSRLLDENTCQPIAEVLSAEVETPAGPMEFRMMVKGSPEMIESGESVFLSVARMEE